MLKLSFPCLAIGVFAIACSVHAADYGVGFGLSLDYGVASVYFKNGSTIDIAKIEGGVAYKQVMRDPDFIRPENYRLDDAAAQLPLGLQSLRDWLPPWLGGQDSRTQALSTMLKALKTAMEAYLNAPLSNAEVVVPFTASESLLDALRAACSSLSLRMPRSNQPPGGILAAQAHGIGGECEYLAGYPPLDRPLRDDPEQLILTVDYSRAALTVHLVAEECGIFESVRTLHDTTLGTDALLSDPETPGPSSGRARLASGLRGIMDLPLKDGNGAWITFINELVTMGESATDPRLHDALVTVFSEQPHNAYKALGEQRRGIVDPVFAASQGLAWDCWGRLDYEPEWRLLQHHN